MTAIAGYTGAVLISSPPSVTLPSNLALVDSGDHTTFKVAATGANSAYRYWDPSVAMTFQTAPDGSTWTTVAPSIIRYVGGWVTFASAVTGGTPSARVTAGSYFPYGTLANITQWQFDGIRNFQDATVMTASYTSGTLGAGSQYKIFAPLLLEGAFTITKFWVPETSEGYVGYLKNGTLLMVSGVEFSGNRYEGYAYLKKMSIPTDVQKLVESPLDLQVTGNFYPV